MELLVSQTESNFHSTEYTKNIVTVWFIGFIVGVWKGIIRTIPISGYESILDLIPIDISVNLIIAAAWDTATDIT